MKNVYTARQPIFNRKKAVVAYELLFRDNETNSFPVGVPADVATSKLLVNSFLNMDVDDLTNNKVALVNFPTELLCNNVSDFLPSDKIIIEVLETVCPNQEMFECFRRLFHKRYKIALDDFEYSPVWDRFMPFVKLIKMDILVTGIESSIKIMEHLKKNFPHLKFLAEKVETNAEYKACLAGGFDFFQGYFFCRPEVVKGKMFEFETGVFAQVYALVMKKDCNYNKISTLIQQDPVLTEKILRYVNSPMFGRNKQIKAVRQAIGYMGETQLRIFISLFSNYYLNNGKPSELIKTATIRGRFCELIARKSMHKIDTEEAYLTGLMSTIDAILDTEMKQIMSRLPLKESIKDALVSENGIVGAIIKLVKSYEQGHWEDAEKLRAQLDLNPTSLSNSYQDAILFQRNCDEIFL